MAEKFQLLLARNSVNTGEAFNNAKEIFKEQRHRQNTIKNVPKAWNKLISEPDGLIIDLLGETVEKISGYKAEQKIVLDFLRKYKKQFIVKQQLIEEQMPNNTYRQLDKREDADWRERTSDKKKSKMLGNIYPLIALKNKEVTHKRPRILIIENREINIRSWSQLCTEFVRYLYDTDRFSKKDLPIFNASGKDKYFIMTINISQFFRTSCVAWR